MPDPDKEHWVDLYRMAMMELENAQLAERIGDARIEIAARLEKLRDISGLHTGETRIYGSFGSLGAPGGFDVMGRIRTTASSMSDLYGNRQWSRARRRQK